jgi:hypothetical protein
MRQLTKTLKAQRGLDSTFVGINFGIGLTFGDTELKAFIQWEENVRAPNLRNVMHSICAYLPCDHSVFSPSTGRQKARARNYYTQCASLIPSSGSAVNMSNKPSFLMFCEFGSHGIFAGLGLLELRV